MNARVMPIFLALVTVLVVVVLFWWPQSPAPSSARPLSAPILAGPDHGQGVFRPLPPPPALSPEKVALGERLFFDKRLSQDNSIACASCHDFARGGSDRMRVALGIGQQPGPINTPTVFNAALNFVQFWDGRAATLEEQAAGPVHNPLEMGSSWSEVIAKLRADKDYLQRFSTLYPQRGITGETIVDAIATYERTLITPNSRFDRFLQGDSSALNAIEQSGYRRFLDYGCASCHQGVLLGGNMYQRFGVMGDYFAGRTTTMADLGRFNVTGRDEDRHAFKVPSLRNIAVTPPYFHDGSALSLEEAIIVMGRFQLGRELSGPDVAAISAFLHTLTGEWQGKPLQ
ncbi:hypothetical protein MASR1M60_00180 [Rhodocyclaceae bacterium]